MPLNYQDMELFGRWLAHLPEVLWRADSQGNVDYLGPGVVAITGYDIEECRRGGVALWQERVHPEDRERVRQHFAASLVSDHPLDVEYRFLRKDGKWIWVQTHSLCVYEQNGMRFVDGISSDITARCEAQQLLQLRTEQLQAITQAMMAFLQSGDWKVASTSLLRAALAQSQSQYGLVGSVSEHGRLRVLAYEGKGWSPAPEKPWMEAARQSFAERGYIEFETLDNLFGTVISSGQPVVANDAMTDPRASRRAPAGHPELRSFLGVPIRWGEQTVGLIGVANAPQGYGPAERAQLELMAQAAGVIYDSYQRQEREAVLRAQLQESEERYRRRVENSYDLLFESDAEGTCLYASPSYREFTGYDPAEVMGISIFSRIHPDDAPLCKEAFRRGIMSGVVTPVIYRMRHKNGQWRWIESSGRAFRTPQGELRGIGVCRDITNRRQAEALAQQQQAQLAHLSRIHAVGQLASGLAHELNQPLGAILNYAGACAEMIEQPEPPRASLQEALQEISHETTRAGQIIRRLRGFLRKQEPQAALLRLQEVVRESLHLLAPELRQRGVQCQVSLAEELAPVQADQIQIEQVLVNLIQNALDAMEGIPVEKRQLWVSAEANDERYAAVTIRDAGCGIAPTELARIFDAFYTTKSQGLGIGLSISRSIVEAHGGHLQARANPDGVGMSFQLTLPFYQEKSS